MAGQDDNSLMFYAAAVVGVAAAYMRLVYYPNRLYYTEYADHYYTDHMPVDGDGISHLPPACYESNIYPVKQTTHGFIDGNGHYHAGESVKVLFPDVHDGDSAEVASKAIHQDAAVWEDHQHLATMIAFMGIGIFILTRPEVMRKIAPVAKYVDEALGAIFGII